jgi:3-deoxy-D-manno-octulosonate 8-phosphate phosphatase (KDO 8-P phosphatase)
MESFLTKLKDITTFIFDVDGVLTDGTIFVSEDGRQTRAFNIKDGYAMQLAVKCGYSVCTISGSRSKSALYRLNSLGIQDVYMGIHTKIEKVKLYLEEKHLSPEKVIYVGDDITDYEAMKIVGLPVCPADAAEEVKAISKYISPFNGGRGCARDIIEKVLKVQNKWMTDEAFTW